MTVIVTEETPAENAGENSPVENAADVAVASAVETAREAERAEMALEDIREESAEIIKAAHEATETAEAVAEEVAQVWQFTEAMFSELSARIFALEERVAALEPKEGEAVITPPVITTAEPLPPEIAEEPEDRDIRPRRFGRL